MAYLKCYFPHYLGYCPVQDIHFCFVPQEKISCYYSPEARLAEILTCPRDSLEEEVAKFASHLIETTRITSGDLGVTGSVLLGIHDPHLSDIDLVVYGLENALRIREVLSYGQTNQMDQASGGGRDYSRLQEAGVRPEGEKRKRSWCLEKVRNFGLSLQEARYFASRRWNHGFYGGRYFSIRPVKNDAEIKENYGDHSYRNVGRATIQATISSTQQSLFLPARYEVEDVKVLELEMRSEEKISSCMPGGEVTLSPGEKSREQPGGEFLTEIVSYVELYYDAFEANDIILARGKLEKVDGQYYRLVIGSLQGENIEYVKREHI
jgi:predicted nucleotidyltransferase